MLDKAKVAVFGCGVMGGCMLQTWLSSGTLRPDQVWATVGPGEPTEALAARFPGVRIGTDNAAAAAWATVVLLSVKPHIVEPVLAAADVRHALLLSIAAGRDLASFHALGVTRVVRVMPNVTCALGEGMTTFAHGADVSPADRALACALFAPLGRSLELPERNMAAATAIAGCGPAFFALFAEALADGGVLLGLPRQAALDLALQTMRGTAAMLLDEKPRRHPAQLRDAVCTPGGATIRGLAALEHHGVRHALSCAVLSAAGSTCTCCSKTC